MSMPTWGGAGGWGVGLGANLRWCLFEIGGTPILVRMGRPDKNRWPFEVSAWGIGFRGFGHIDVAAT